MKLMDIISKRNIIVGLNWGVNMKSFLVKTTYEQIAEDVSNLPIGEELYFSTLDNDFLQEYEIEPYEFFRIGKVQFNFQSGDNYSIIICYMDFNRLKVQSIDVVSYNHADDENYIKGGIKDFLYEYCLECADDNPNGDIFYYKTVDDDVFEYVKNYIENSKKAEEIESDENINIEWSIDDLEILDFKEDK